jgi:hypothetical protein
MKRPGSLLKPGIGGLVLLRSPSGSLTMLDAGVEARFGAVELCRAGDECFPKLELNNSSKVGKSEQLEAGVCVGSGDFLSRGDSEVCPSRIGFNDGLLSIGSVDCPSRTCSGDCQPRRILLLVDRAGVGVISDARLFVAALSSSSPFALVVSNLLVCRRIVRLLGVCRWLPP